MRTWHDGDGGWVDVAIACYVMVVAMASMAWSAACAYTAACFLGWRSGVILPFSEDVMDAARSIWAAVIG